MGVKPTGDAISGSPSVQRLVSVVRRSLARFVELEGIDRSMALAGQAFAALLPLLIVIGAIAPSEGNDLADSVAGRFDLTGSAEETLRTAVGDEPATHFSVLGTVLLVISSLSFTRAMQRLYVRAWRLTPLGLRGNLWGLGWLALFVVFWLLQPPLIGLLDGVTAFAASLALSTLLWLGTPWLLVARRIPWRRLLPQALLTTVALDAVAVGAAIYLPYAMSSASREFGVLGVAFTMLSLLFVIAIVLVASAALGATLAGAGSAQDEWT